MALDPEGYIRDDQAQIILTVDGITYDNDGSGTASWATYEGGKLTVSGSKTRAGGMGDEVEIGGLPSRGDVTITIQNSDTMLANHATLESRLGKGKWVVVLTALDEEGNVRTGKGARFTLTGKGKEASKPGGNFGSSAAGMYTVVVGVNQVAS